MFLAIQAIGPFVRGFTTVTSAVLRKRNLSIHLPILAVDWFRDIERISGGIVRLKFNPDEVVQAIRTSEHTPESEKAVIMNAKWNILWGRYCLEILEGKFFPMMKYGFNNVVRFNTRFLEDFGESEPPFTPQPIGRTGKMGFDLITGDLVGNSYTDVIWGDLVDGLESLTSFRTNYVQATKTPGFIDQNTAILAKSIALSEIAWSNNFFPFRDVSDMITFETMWRGRFFTGMMDNFIKAANLAGAGMTQLSSREIIWKIGANPDKPIEEVLV